MILRSNIQGFDKAISLRSFVVSLGGIILCMFGVVFLKAEEDESNTPANLTSVVKSLGLKDVDLPNQVFFGGEPAKKEHFVALQSLGVKTIVSVDGLPPNLELAQEFGMEYVHIPLKYSGVTRNQTLALARVFMESNDALYVHCHLGKHRAPAAVAAMLRACNEIDQEESLALLKNAGTKRSYAGLWHDVRTAKLLEDDEELPELRQIQEVDDLAKTMASFVKHMDGMRAKTRSNQARAYSALLLQDGMKELVRSEKLAGNTDPDYMELLTGAAERLESVQKILASENPSQEKVQGLMKQIGQSCTNCHANYR
ncbi:MAG: hypothetical protein AAF483_08395 [Planctomycetota bacterium]